MDYSFIKPDIPAVVLAPMEGVTDHHMRSLQTKVGNYTYCVSEFLRVSHEVLSKKFVLRHIPELNHDGKIASGVPIQVQILGGNPELIAQTAQVVVECGAKAIDLNFGCPAKLVNRHDGGSALLKYPERIRQIVNAVRTALPTQIPVSAKLRLGWDNIHDIHRNSEEAAIGGAQWLTIHARTKSQGYAPPVYWEPIKEVRERLKIPIVANGDIWSFEDFLRCRDVTGCIHYMLGRGGIANPTLSYKISKELGIAPPNKTDFDPCSPDSWLCMLKLFVDCQPPDEYGPKYFVNRSKQWMSIASMALSRGSKNTPELKSFGFETIKYMQSFDEIISFLESANSKY